MTTANTIPAQATTVPGLADQVRPFVDKLPGVEFQHRSNGEIDYYGASFCIARSLGMLAPLFSRTTWTHGWRWYDMPLPEMLTTAESKSHNNLVISRQNAELLKSFGHRNAIAVGAPFLYAQPEHIRRVPGSIIVFPRHSTQCAKHKVGEDALDYILFIKNLKNKFSHVVVSVGMEDVRRGNWTAMLESHDIPWISGAWTYDANALVRMHAMMRQFEFATTNTYGSHIAYAAYCGCKISLHGPKCLLTQAEYDTHPHYRRNPHLARMLKERDLLAEFRSRFPFFCVAPGDAVEQVDWARQALGEENKRSPEEIAELFEWRLRKLPSGRWEPVDPDDALTCEELLAKAQAESQAGRHGEAFRLTNILKRRHVRLQGVEVLRARYFLGLGSTHGAREALKEELRHFPANAQAEAMFQELGGDALTPHVARCEDDREFIEMFNRVRPYTRLGIQRAKSLYSLAVRVCQENVPGNFVECGVAAGGATMLLAQVVQKHSRIPRTVFAFDTFTGMPTPGEDDTANGVPADDTGWGAGTCAAPEEFVQARCRELGLGDIVKTRKGLFDDTLPANRDEVGEIALLHMDADWYSSTMTILDTLFDQLHPGALIQIDDYGAWDGCKKAILEYSARHGLFFDVHEIDNTGVWCAKPAKPGNPGKPAKPAPGEAFLDPQLTPEFADLYLVRKGILERLDKALPLFGGVLLDVGCGQMPYREHILASNPRITRYIGMDFATGTYAERKEPDLAWDGAAIPLPDASVDCALATEVLEHCPDPAPVLAEIRRVLRPGGLVFFTVPFLWPLHDAPHDHYRYTPFALERLLAGAGFEDARVEALGGWNAALAQMLGLWLRRAPMDAAERTRMTDELFPLYRRLAESDVPPADFLRNPMITGLSGTARAPGAGAAKAPQAGGSRVVVLTDQFPVLSQTFILDQMTGLIDRGVRLEHWSLERMDAPVVHENVAKYRLLETTRFLSLPPDALRAEPQRWAERFLRDNALDPLDDVAAVQIHFGPNFNKLAPLFAAYPNLFVVVSFHGYDGSATFRVKGADFYDGLFARADRITTPSEFMKQNLVRHGCAPDKITVHHYGKDTAAFAPPPARQDQDGQGQGDRVRLLSVARFVEKKGLEYSLAAFAKAQAGLDAQYRIVGYGPLEPELTALVRELDVEDKVVFLGQLTNEAVRQEMAQADIFVLTSVTAANGDEEGVPVSLIEAQALGLPVVSSRHAGIPELVAHGETGFLAGERDVTEIAGHMRALMRNPAIRAAFAANARQRVLREFDLARLNDTLAGLLLRRGVFCPVCRTGHESFLPFGATPRPNALCPSCSSLERHRSLWLFLERHTDFGRAQGLRLLHFAPEACLETHFRRQLGTGYVTADLLDPRADVRCDITSLRFPDASFDAVCCSHVLEHVPDDRAAMREMHRVLADGGLALVMAPVRGDVTEEDLTLTDPAERARRYGQADHVRYYGQDITDRLADAGFRVQRVDIKEAFSAQEREAMRLGGGFIFLCRKGPDAGTGGPDGTDSGQKLAERKIPSEDRAQALDATARHWSRPGAAAPRARWWMHPAILRHINALVCGQPLDGPWAGLEQRMRTLAPGGVFRRGISVGCGSASKELGLLQRGVVERFDLFELSPERVERARAAAQRLGVADRAAFHVRAPFDMDLGGQYDLVYWNNALHHMFDVRRALLWSRDRLRPGGRLVLDDYVGASRFQWPDAHLEIASRVRRALPERLLRDPADPERLCPVARQRPGLADMLATDPSEAADSDNILPALRQIFPDAEVLPTGGVIYNLALKDVLANFDDARDAELLQDLLARDAELAAQGQTQYACAFAAR